MFPANLDLVSHPFDAAMKCEICSKDFDYPEYEADWQFSSGFGGSPGVTCDECTKVIVNGSAEDLDALIARNK